VLGRLIRRRSAPAPPTGPTADALRRMADQTDEHVVWAAGFAQQTQTGAELLGRPREELAALVIDALAVSAASDARRSQRDWVVHRCGVDLAAQALRRRPPFDDEQLARLVVLLDGVGAATTHRTLYPGIDPVKPILLAIERAYDGPAPPALHDGLRRVAGRLSDDAEGRRAALRIAVLTGAAAREPKLPAKDPWVVALRSVDEPAAGPLLALAATATTSRPTKAFLAARDRLLVDADARRVAVLLLEAAAAERGAGREQGPPPEVGDVLRGLAWIAAGAGGEDAARALTAMAITGYRKLPWFGPLCAKAANAAIAALAELPEGAGHLGHLRSRLKRPSAVEAVEAAMDRAAETLGIPRAEFEERTVPDFGLGRDGTGEVAELNVSAKEVKAMVGSQRLRLERLMVEDRTWPGAAFRERYLDHGLVGPLARRLIWTVDGEPALGADIAALADDATVRLWHPVDAGVEEVRDWRARLEEAEVTQPFKQAHREIYLLTDAERATETYSNRFAAHVLRQHQMAALAHGRGWRYALQGDFDAEPIASLALGGLRAELWIDRLPEDTTSSGIYPHVLTEQVRFLDADGSPVPLAGIPPRLFSEVMRDVDLFVGVTSIGNDPTWADRDAHRDYWTAYAFGELSGQATTRREILEGLLPKLAIADVARIDGRYLRVQGKLRAYRIHLGSGNILMEPNDEYLCIVAGRDGKTPRRVYLPFEGDYMLSQILSQALLLARDDRIDDATISRQIRG
jgi:hypothetical protein